VEVPTNATGPAVSGVALYLPVIPLRQQIPASRTGAQGTDDAPRPPSSPRESPLLMPRPLTYLHELIMCIVLRSDEIELVDRVMSDEKFYDTVVLRNKGCEQVALCTSAGRMTMLLPVFFILGGLDHLDWLFRFRRHFVRGGRSRRSKTKRSHMETARRDGGHINPTCPPCRVFIPSYVTSMTIFPPFLMSYQRQYHN
jgi:hypothetical protein